MKVIEGIGEIWYFINMMRIKFDLRNWSEILYLFDCRCIRWKWENIWNWFKFDGGYRIGVDIDIKWWFWEVRLFVFWFVVEIIVCGFIGGVIV